MWNEDLERDYQRLRRAEREAELRDTFEGLPDDFVSEAMELCLAEDSDALLLSERGRPTARSIVERLGALIPKGDYVYDLQREESFLDELVPGEET